MRHSHNVLPEHYQEKLYLNVSDPDTLTTLSNLSVWGLGLSIVACAAWVMVVKLFFPAVNFESTPTFLMGLLIVVGVLPLHELIHGIFIQLMGHTPRYGAKWVKVNRYLRLPYLLYATTDQAYFTRNQFIAIALAPLILITLLGFTLIALLPSGYLWPLSAALIMNGSGAVGDVWMTWLTLKSHKDALIKDEADAIRIYEPAN